MDRHRNSAGRNTEKSGEYRGVLALYWPWIITRMRTTLDLSPSLEHLVAVNLEITEALLKQISFERQITTSASGERRTKATPASVDCWEVYDTRLEGFFLRVRSSGVTFYLRGSIKGTGLRKKIQLGRWPDIDLKKARAMATAASAKMRAGLDPSQESIDNARATLQAKERASYTFDKAWDDWATRTATKVSASTVEDRGYARAWLVGSPLWSKSLWSVDEKVIDATLTPLFDWVKGDPRPAWGPKKDTMSWSALRKIINYLRPAYRFAALDKKIITHGDESPVRAWESVHEILTDPPRTRFLNHGQASGQNWLKALVDRYEAEHDRARPSRTPYSGVMVDYVLLLLLWGTRRGETRLLRTDDVLLEQGLVTFRGETTKSGKAYGVPITPWGEEILRARMKENARLQADSPWLFPSRVAGKHIYKADLILQELQEETGVKLTQHDLRRTMGTDQFGAESLERDVTRLLMAGAVLNHSGVDRGTVNPVTMHYIQEVAKVKRPDFVKRENLLRKRAGLEPLGPGEEEAPAAQSMAEMIAADPAQAMMVLSQLMAIKKASAT